MTQPTMTIPLVDMQGVRERDPQSLARAGAAIRRACTEVGFFYIVNHGLPQTAIDDAMQAARAFFAEPLERKTEVAVNKRHRGFHRRGGATMYQATRPDEKEFYSFGLDLAEDDPSVLAGEALRGPNQWPSFMPEFQRAMDRYFLEVGRCGADLLRAAAGDFTGSAGKAAKGVLRSALGELLGERPLRSRQLFLRRRERQDG